MDQLSFDNLLVVMAVGAAIPFVLGLARRVPVPSSVFEILAGIVIGPHVLHWVEIDQPVSVLSNLGVAFLLFLAGLELEFRLLRGHSLRVGLAGYGITLLIGIVLTFPLGEDAFIIDPLLVTVILSATSVGIVVPVLADARRLGTTFGDLVVVSCSVAEFGSIVMLSLFFSSSDPDPTAAVVKFVAVAAAVALIAGVALTARRSRRLIETIERLQETSAELRVRITVLLLLGLLVLTSDFGFDAVLGAFMAGALFAALSENARDQEFGFIRRKLHALGFGFLVPVFFVTTGVQFPAKQLLEDPAALGRVGIFLALLLAVRGIPALVLLRRDLGWGQVVAAGLLQATSLSFIVVGTTVGVRIGELRPVNAAALVAAGMLSVLVFPVSALGLLERHTRRVSPAVPA